MISEAELAKKIAKWQKTPDGKRRTKEYVDGLRATGGTTVSGQKVIGQKDMDNAAKILIEEIQRRLPESLKELGDSLVCTQAVKLADGQYEMAIRFSDPLHRDSLENDLGYDGIDNIVALFNNGYHAKNYVYGWWNKHKPTGAALARSIPGDDFAWVRSRREREALHFIQDAVDAFNKLYGQQYSATAFPGADYTE